MNVYTDSYAGMCTDLWFCVHIENVSCQAFASVNTNKIKAILKSDESYYHKPDNSKQLYVGYSYSALAINVYSYML